MGILFPEVMPMKFRYFDLSGRQIPPEELGGVGVTTPVMDHVFATVLERLENAGSSPASIEKSPPA